MRKLLLVLFTTLFFFSINTVLADTDIKNRNITSRGAQVLWETSSVSENVSFTVDFRIGEDKILGTAGYTTVINRGVVSVVVLDPVTDEPIVWVNLISKPTVAHVDSDLKYAAMSLEGCGVDFVTNEQVCMDFIVEWESPGGRGNDTAINHYDFGCRVLKTRYTVNDNDAIANVAYNVTDSYGGILYSGNVTKSGSISHSEQGSQWRTKQDCDE